MAEEDGYDGDDGYVGKLCKLSGRRTSKQHRNRQETCFDDDGQMCLSSTSGSEYLCEYDDESKEWRSRQDIEDDGYGTLCDAYDREHQGNQAKKKKVSPDEGAANVTGVLPGQLVRDFGGMKILFDMTAGAIKPLRYVLRYAPVDNTSMERSFRHLWMKRDSLYRPELVFVAIDADRLHHVRSNGIDTHCNKLAQQFQEPYNEYLWVSLFPGEPLERTKSDLLMLCAALTSPAFLVGENWKSFERTNGWFPMPVQPRNQALMIPLVLFQTMLKSQAQDMDRLRGRDPTLMKYDELAAIIEGSAK